MIAKNGYMPERTLLFVFAGDLRKKSTTYSGGARQAIYNLLKNQTVPDVKFLEGHVLGYK